MKRQRNEHIPVAMAFQLWMGVSNRVTKYPIFFWVGYMRMDEHTEKYEIAIMYREQK